jgi:PAS domain S-box-containing protein
MLPLSGAQQMKRRLTGTTLGLALGVTAAVVAACAAGAYLFYTHHYQALLETERAGALGEGELIRIALEHQMIENDRSRIARMIDSFGQRPRVEQVVLLDRSGMLRFSSRPEGGDPNDLHIDSPTCQACHRLPPDQRGSSRVIEARGGAVLRTVVPIGNRKECFRCHDPQHRINGILIIDRNAEQMRSEMMRDLRWLVAGTGALTLLLVITIALVIRHFVLRRLQRFETTARLIAGGDFGRRVPEEGSDTIAWLAREFNTMADSVTGLANEVRTQGERLETVINSIDDGIVVLDTDRKIIAANEAFLRRAGQSRENVLGSCCGEIGAGACTAADCPVLSCLRQGARQVRICERSAPDGATVWEEIHASPIFGPSGNLAYVVEVWRDISERRAAEAHLAESHRLASLGMLASGFSHELNTPLATVLTCVEGILRAMPADRDGPANLGRIGENASIARDQILRCRGITQHFLRMSRGQSSRGDLVDLGASIDAVARLIEPTARAHSVHVDAQPAAPGIHVRADEAELQQSLINLLLNAIQACKPGGHVKVCYPAGEGVMIRITDDGCGIPPEHLKRIFEPFFSLRKGGTGLGLFLSLNFVRRWGGDIVVESVAGQGAAFEIRLPACGPDRQQENPG